MAWCRRSPATSCAPTGRWSPVAGPERLPAGLTPEAPRLVSSPRILLIGPYDPNCGEYTFLAPPLGVWRLAGVLESAGAEVRVFDPNCCSGSPPRALERAILARPWD